uniref:Uncharacterized protein n=1 Tax=Arundo donax TaxID=35708 RepID=A0A0A9SPZ3_ARUDO
MFDFHLCITNMFTFFRCITRVINVLLLMVQCKINHFYAIFLLC